MKPLLSKNKNKLTSDDFETLTIFREKFKNRLVPQKVLNLIEFAETSDPFDFIMNIEHKKDYFIFFFCDFLNNQFYYANSALWEKNGDILHGGFYHIDKPGYIFGNKKKKE